MNIGLKHTSIHSGHFSQEDRVRIHSKRTRSPPRPAIGFGLLLAVALHSQGALALSIVCGDDSFPREVQGRIAFETDVSKSRESYTVLLPESYRGEKLQSAELQVRDAQGALVRVPLAVAKTEVREWRKKLVAFIHTSDSDLPLSVEARYGFPCTWVLTGSVAP